MIAGSPSVYARSSLGPAAVVPLAQPVTEEEMWEHVAAPGWDPARTAAVVGLAGTVQGGSGTVTGGITGAGSERWRVDAPQGGFLRVSGNWDEGWSARVDGEPADVLRADGVFRGVELAPGVHVVTFAYLDPAESSGRLVAAGGAAARPGHRLRTRALVADPPGTGFPSRGRRRRQPVPRRRQR